MTVQEYTEKDLCINVLLTSVCNAGCSWCIADDFMKRQRASKLMPKENMQVLLDRLEKERILQVNLLGGEPSLHPEALNFGREINRKGNTVGFSTNALWGNSFREKFSNIDYPLEVEITYLGKDSYSSEKLKRIFKTFDQLKGHTASLGIILDNPGREFKEHLDIAERYGFDLRWAIVEPTIKTGMTEGYQSLKNIKKLGRRAIQIIEEANKRGIQTWADLTVPYCSISPDKHILFEGCTNDIQFRCPPFFDISPDLDIWRCLPLAEDQLSSLRDFDSFAEAYKKVNEIKKDYYGKGIFDECLSCRYIDNICSGGPAIAKKIKDGS
jgi:hypothetical protein